MPGPAKAQRQLLLPNDAVTKSLMLRGRSHIGTEAYDGRRREVVVSGRGAVRAPFKLRPVHAGGFDAIGGELNHFDLLVCAALAARAQAGVLGFTSHDVLRALGYANPHAAGMSATAEAVVASVKKMASLEIEMGAARGSDGEPRLSAIPRSRLFCCSASTLGASGGLTLAPPDAKQPLSAIPLALRACECKQVIPIEPGQMPDFSGRRVSAAQRQMALYLVARALEKKTSKSVLVSTMLRDLGVSFGRGDAGRQARSRALRQLIKTLDAMAAQGAVIDGYEIESVRGRTRAIVLHPVRSQTTDN
ncbi:MAG TPA: hypothetical protein DCP91_07380 [Eggerthellaceae bacterium]|nr:hypothetical protein [Eggerthellaceae bacterium]